MFRNLVWLGLAAVLALATAWLIGNQLIVNFVAERERLREETEQLKADFTAMIAHDLRSPLTAVTIGAGIIEDGLAGPVTEEQKQILARMQMQSRNLVDLASDFLDLSKIEAGHISLDKKTVNLREIAQAGMSNTTALAQEKGISLRNAVDAALPKIDADARRLDQVFSNLLGNAVKFTPRGGEIEVGASMQDSRVKLWVKDSGVGIPAAEIDDLFQKYRQTKSGKSAAQKGTGLGLVICKMIVEAHGGKIWAESEEGKGTTFFFTLPKV
jgi:signal transduction histidine kinase